ncbi:lipopolysaccharide heptosyltransferase II [Selenomonas sp. TAMA-11512]|uniref:glycosyltransferase family 9 protein n=1 Tax=Selenomonas sp. TAMA-11512 TaxID=3095337 RepID=UPI00308CCE0E|nr:lipopolysaccharide heptosyltransferase II [Selenomonas sp. TAMA-11512]
MVIHRYAENIYLRGIRFFDRVRGEDHSDAPRKKAVVFICRQPLGDAVLSTIVLRGVRKAYEGAHLFVVTSRANRTFFEASSYADEVLVLEDTVHRVKKQRRLVREFCREHFRDYDVQLAIIPNTGMPNIFEAFLTHYSGAKRRAAASEVFHPVMHREYMGQYDAFFTDVYEEERVCHEVESNLAMLSMLGVKEDLVIEVFSTAADKERADALLAPHRDELAGKVKLFVNPATSDVARDYPVERYAEICRRLREEKEIACILLGYGEKAARYSGAFCAEIPEAIDLTNKTTIGEMIEIIRQTDFYLGGDTGPLHIAAALKKQGVAVFRSSDGMPPLALDHIKRHPWDCGIVTMRPEHALAGCESGCRRKEAHCILQVCAEDVYRALHGQLDADERKSDARNGVHADVES